MCECNHYLEEDELKVVACESHCILSSHSEKIQSLWALVVFPITGFSMSTSCIIGSLHHLCVYYFCLSIPCDFCCSNLSTPIHTCVNRLLSIISSVGNSVPPIGIRMRIAKIGSDEPVEETRLWMDREGIRLDPV
mgnify:CR=1 FL=1